MRDASDAGWKKLVALARSLHLPAPPLACAAYPHAT